MWSREWNIKMRSWIKVYNIVEKSLFGDINMEVDIWKKWISLCKKYISFDRWKSPVVVGRVWARPLESCGLRAPLLHQAGSSSSGVMVGHRPLWTKRRGWGEVREKISKNQGVPEKIPFWQKIGAKGRVMLKHRAMFSTFGSSDHYCEPGIVNTGQ